MKRYYGFGRVGLAVTAGLAVALGASGIMANSQITLQLDQGNFNFEFDTPNIDEITGNFGPGDIVLTGVGECQIYWLNSNADSKGDCSTSNSGDAIINISGGNPNGTYDIEFFEGSKQLHPLPESTHIDSETAESNYIESAGVQLGLSGQFNNLPSGIERDVRVGGALRAAAINQVGNSSFTVDVVISPND